MPKSYAYCLDFAKEDAKRMDTVWRKAGLSRSALFRMAIEDIPVDEVIARLGGLEIPRPIDLAKGITFTIWQDHRDRLDRMKRHGVELAFVLRHSMMRYLEMDTDDLRRIPGTMIGSNEQRRLIEGEALRKKLGKLDEFQPHGASERIAIAQDPERRKKIKVPPIPVRSPKIDWTHTGPVLPPDEGSPAARQAVKDFRPTVNAAERAGLPGDVLEGVDMTGPESGVMREETLSESPKPEEPKPTPPPQAAPAPAAALSPLDILRRKQGK